MPLGIIMNSLAIAIGGLIGAKGGDRLSGEFKDKLNSISPSVPWEWASSQLC